jgi:hypothetical protein
MVYAVSDVFEDENECLISSQRLHLVAGSAYVGLQLRKYGRPFNYLPNVTHARDIVSIILRQVAEGCIGPKECG